MLGKFFSLPNLFGVVDILTLIIVSSTASNATVVMTLLQALSRSRHAILRVL
jgi:hypothetical protein